MPLEDKNSDYVIKNDDFDKQPDELIRKIEKDGYALVEEESQKKTPQDTLKEIEDAAKKEGLYGKVKVDSDIESMSPEEVVQSFINSDKPEGYEEIKEKQDKETVKKYRKVTATREKLFGRLKRHIEVTIPIYDEEYDEVVEWVFEVKRLSESELQHLFNKDTVGKKPEEMTQEQYMDSMKFRRKLLARAIVNPKLSEREWGELVDNDILMEIHEKVNEALAETITDKDDFQ